MVQEEGSRMQAPGEKSHHRVDRFLLPSPNRGRWGGGSPPFPMAWTAWEQGMAPHVAAPPHMEAAKQGALLPLLAPL